jgi:hypothetical protein
MGNTLPRFKQFLARYDLIVLNPGNSFKWIITTSSQTIYVWYVIRVSDATYNFDEELEGKYTQRLFKDIFS